ncbi:MAG: hypothetical protein KGK01_08860 [Bradyrhizobium sp.]|uniref:hypothetical protein n=1 Tax=Bradyrhizobium sp. TaxID=376 RepID=UPI001C28A242|nr:hypothetical protein [Bradyrhizobium sp.]MBU6462279.1 hypothetical protein [Pseudomonadota bacterium]MDE2242536.1 hypothetical protein [Bradyrhizobium sp.]
MDTGSREENASPGASCAMVLTAYSAKALAEKGKSAAFGKPVPAENTREPPFALLVVEGRVLILAPWLTAPSI